MAEIYKLESVHRRVITDQWTDDFFEYLLSRFGERITNTKTGAMMALQLTRRRDMSRSPLYVANNVELAERKVIKKMPPTFLEAIHDVRVKRLGTIPTSRDRVIIAELQATTELSEEVSAIGGRILRLGAAQQRGFSYQVGLGYTSQEFKSKELTRIENEFPDTVDLHAGSLEMVSIGVAPARQK